MAGTKKILLKLSTKGTKSYFCVGKRKLGTILHQLRVNTMEHSLNLQKIRMTRISSCLAKLNGIVFMDLILYIDHKSNRGKIAFRLVKHLKHLRHSRV